MTRRRMPSWIRGEISWIEGILDNLKSGNRQKIGSRRMGNRKMGNRKMGSRKMGGWNGHLKLVATAEMETLFIYLFILTPLHPQGICGSPASNLTYRKPCPGRRLPYAAASSRPHAPVG